MLSLEEFVEINGEKIYFFVQRKRIKNLNLKVNVDKTVTLSIPMRLSMDVAKDFVRKKSGWIKKQQNFYERVLKEKENLKFENDETVHLHGKKYKLEIIKNTVNGVNVKDDTIEIYVKEKYADNAEYISRVYDKWLREYALEVFEKVVIEYQKILKDYGVKMPKIEVRKTKAIWGSCMPMKNKVTFNLNLIKTPMECIEYVVLHELSHFKFQNHSKNFYNFIAMFMPDWKERKRILDKEYIGIGRK